MIKVFVGGEGSNEIGTRGDQPMGETPGVVETLLRRVRPAGWSVAGKRAWRSVRKYRAGAARHADHADVHNVLGLVLEAYENACEVLAFVRDCNGDELRALLRTDEMSNARAEAELATAQVPLKSTAHYVAIAETRVLPTGPGSLQHWLAQADTTFRRLIDGALRSHSSPLANARARRWGAYGER